MQIRGLEKTLGVELVERRPGEAVLTAIGREFALRGEQVLAGRATSLISPAIKLSRYPAGCASA